MMLLFIYVMSMAWFANLIAWKLEFKFWLWLKDNYLQMKLFNCSSCFGFWFSFILTIALTGSLVISFPLAILVSLVATIMETNLCRLN